MHRLYKMLGKLYTTNTDIHSNIFAYFIELLTYKERFPFSIPLETHQREQTHTHTLQKIEPSKNSKDSVHIVNRAILYNVKWNRR